MSVDIEGWQWQAVLFEAGVRSGGGKKQGNVCAYEAV